MIRRAIENRYACHPTKAFVKKTLQKHKHTAHGEDFRDQFYACDVYFFFLRSGICLFEFGLCDRQQRIKIIAIKPLWVRSRIVMVKAYSSFGLHEKCLVIFEKNLSFRPFVCLPIGNAGNIFSSILLLWVFCFFSSSSVFFLFVFITTTTSLSIHLMSV